MGNLVGLATMPLAILLLLDAFSKEPIVPKNISIIVNIIIIVVNVSSILLGEKNDYIN